jgi:hypothetical protein
VQSQTVELKTWLTLPGFPPISIENPRANETVDLPPGFYQDYGAMSLLKISHNAQARTCVVSVRLMDPVTGAFISADRQALWYFLIFFQNNPKHFYR